MAYNHHHHLGLGYGYGWSPYKEYQLYENGGMTEPPIRRRFDGPPHPKGRPVRLRSQEEEEEDIAEAEAEAGTQSLAETERALDSLRHRHRKDVNEEADAFIKLEHRRIQLTKLMSMGPI